jgi:hypothetical protein
MSFYFNSEKSKAAAARSAAREAKNRAKPLGVSLNQYATARRISKWKAGVHRDTPNFPKFIGEGGGVRKIKYYNEKELEKYFADAEDCSLDRVKLNIIKLTAIRNEFITTNWTGIKLSKRCSLAEDDAEQ